MRYPKFLTAVAAAAVALTPAAAHAGQPGPVNGVDYHNVNKAGYQGDCDKARYDKGWQLIGDFNVGRHHQQMDYVNIIRSLRAGGFTWQEMPMAVGMLSGESDRCSDSVHYNRDAHGRITSTDFGCWQINTYWHPEAKKVDLFNCAAASKVARRIYLAHGWREWNAYAWVAKPGSIYRAGVDWQIAHARALGVN